MKERVIALFIMALAAVLFISAFSIAPPRWEPLGAAFMAKAFSAGLFILGLILAISAFRVPVAEGDAPRTSDGMAVTFQLFGALALYLLGLDFGQGALSYFAFSIGFFLLCAYILAPQVFRDPLKLGITSVAACILCGFIGWGFSQVLHVSLP